MKKQELVHLHGLFAEIAAYCRAEGVPLALERYHELGIHPMSINHAKSDHEEAVLALAAALAAALDAGDGEAVPVRAD